MNTRRMFSLNFAWNGPRLCTTTRVRAAVARWLGCIVRSPFLGPRELELYAALAGFDVVQITDGTGAGALNGPVAYTVARYR